MVATVQRLIEESLVTPNDRRCSMVDDYLIASYPGVTQDFLDVLVDSRLLRKENRLNDFYYEISHDTLLPAIVESRDNRRRQEKAERDRAEQEAKKAEEARRWEEVNAQLAAARKQRRLARTVAMTSFISLLVTLGFGVWFVRDYINAAKDQLQSAERSVRDELYGAAIPSYEELLSHPRRCWVLLHSDPPKVVADELAIAQSFDSLYQLVDDSLTRGDGLFFRDDYATALDAYRHAETLQRNYESLNRKYSPVSESGDTLWRVDTARVQARFRTLSFRNENASKALIREFKIRQRDYEVFFEAKVWGQALRNLQRMKKLLPTHPHDVRILKSELNLDEEPRDYVKWELDRVLAEIRRI
jgi:hypothetical protein